MEPLHAAELDYEAGRRRTPGVTEDEVELDLMRFGLIAASAAETARKAWREYRSTNDGGSRREFDLARVARGITDVLAEGLGLSREAAVVLDEMTAAEFR